MKRMIFATILAIAAFLSSGAEAQQVGAGCTPIGRGATNAFFSSCATATGTANAIILTPTFGNTPTTPQLVKFSTFIFQAIATNTGPTTIALGATSAALMKDGFSGPVVMVGGEIISGNWYTVGYDTGLSKWRLSPGQSSGATMAPEYRIPGVPYARPGGIGPFNYMTGILASSGIVLPPGEYGGHQPCYLDANCFWHGDAYQFISSDPTMTTVFDITAVAAGAGGKVRITVGATTGLSNGDPITVSLTGGTPDPTNLWAAANVTGTTVDLAGWNGAPDSVFGTGYSTPGRATWGELDTSPYALQGRDVPGRLTRFGDSTGFLGGQARFNDLGSTATIVPTWFIGVNLLTGTSTETNAQAYMNLGVSAFFGGGQSNTKSLLIGKGLIVPGCGGTLSSGSAATSAAQLWADDKGSATVHAILGFYADNMRIGQPAVGDASNLVIFNPTNLTINITADSIALRAGDQATACNSTQTPIVTTEYAINQTIDLSSGTGAGHLDAGVVQANKSYAIFIIKKSADGTVAALASLSATAPSLPSGYNTKSFLGWAVTRPSAATLLTFVIAPPNDPLYIVGEGITLDPNAFGSGKTILQAGGGASYSITVGAANTFPKNGSRVIITDTDSAFPKTLIINGVTAGALLPSGQTLTIYDVNNQWIPNPPLAGANSFVGNCTASIAFPGDCLISPPPRIISSGACTVATSDSMVVNATGAAINCTLPSSPTSGDSYSIADNCDAATNPITITPASGNIDAQTSYLLAATCGIVTVEYVSTQWRIK